MPKCVKCLPTMMRILSPIPGITETVVALTSNPNPWEVEEVSSQVKSYLQLHNKLTGNSQLRSQENAKDKTQFPR